MTIGSEASEGFFKVGEPERVHSGMTLRDYFAAFALQGMLAAKLGEEYSTYSPITTDAYRYADSMLKARKS